MTSSRTLAGGLLLGVAGAVLLGLVEIGYLVATAVGYFDGAAELLRFSAVVLALLGAAGAAAGLVAGALGLAVGRFGPRLAADAGRGRARLVALLSAPPAGVVAALLLSGPRARLLPGRWAIWASLLAAAAFGAYVVSLRWLRFASRPTPRARALVALCCVAACVGAYVADQRVLPRLYPAFHLALLALAFVAAQLACAAVATGRGLAGPRAALAVAAAALLGGALAGVHLGNARPLRTFALERAVALGRVARVLPRKAPPPVAPRPAPPRPEVALPAGPRLPDVDVVLITIDALRADRVTPRTAPFLAGLAARGVTFERAYAQVPHTSFSLATLLTGKHVFALSQLGIEAGRHETLAAIFKRERYKTAGFYPPAVFYVDHGRLKDFEDSSYDFEYVKYEYLDAPGRYRQIVEFFESEQPQRAFVWVHYSEPHEPYDLHEGHLPEGVKQPLRAVDCYDSEVRYVDAEIARLVEWIETHRRRALIVVTADHGEEFGEHGGNYHGTTLYDEQVRVPLFFTTVGFDALPARRIAAPVGLVDVAPTLLELFRIPRSLRMRGRDLSPWMSEAGAPESALPPVVSEIDHKKMVLAGHDKLICDLRTEACQVFDLAADPAERRDLSADGARLAGLRGQLDAWIAEEARFERQLIQGAASPEAQRVLERGRHGDRTAAVELARLLGDPAVARQAARLLAELPTEPSTRPALEEAARAKDAEVRDWAQIALARLGDQRAHEAVAQQVTAACHPDEGDPARCAACARILGDVVWLARALEQAGEDRERKLSLIRKLALTHDRRALDPLLIQLAEVRTRVEAALALGTLGDPGALPTLLRWAPADPYISVRKAMIRSIATLAQDEPHRSEARAALAAWAQDEHEPQVVEALDAALRALGGGPRPRTEAGRASRRSRGD